jgi:hypothetical protein
MAKKEDAVTVDPRIDKRRVTMTNYITLAVPDPDNPGETKPEVHVHKAVDYVRPDHLDAYVEDARTRWQVVTVSEEPDAGPGGYHGQTAVPKHLPLPDAGVVYEATSEEDDK